MMGEDTDDEIDKIGQKFKFDKLNEMLSILLKMCIKSQLETERKVYNMVFCTYCYLKMLELQRREET